MTALRLLRLLPPVAVGLGIAAWLVSARLPPERTGPAERSLTVTTTIAAARPLAPVVRGFGNVRPARTWAAVAEVSGSIVWRHPDLATGAMIGADTHVLTIDPSAHELAVTQAQADLAAFRAEAGQIDAEEANTARILAIEQQRLALAEADLKRTRDLVAQGTAPQVRADEQTRATLSIERGVTELRNTLSLIPSRRARLGAQIDRAEAALARAQRDLGNTRIVAPFDLRVGQVSVERHQFVAAGQPLVTGDGIARAEVTAHLPLDAFPRLIAGALTQDTLGQTALERASRSIAAEIRLVLDPAQVWQGRLTRVENALDPQARSVPVVVEVAGPYNDIDPPRKLPLVPNMYVELTLTGPPGDPVIALPDHAVHDGDLVYLRNADGRLDLRTVTVAWRQEGLAIIAEGLDPGAEVVLDDLMPAIPGTRLTVAEPLP